MENVKNIYSRKALVIAASVIVLATAFAAITHAEEREGDHGGIRGFLNVAANVNVNAPNVRVFVGDDNSVRVHGATVTATSTAGFTATTQTPPLTFVVQTNASTRFNVKGAGKGSLANIAVGDTVNFRGTAVSGTTTSTITLNASNVEDKTMHHRKPPATTAQVTVKGTVENVSATTNTIVIVTKNGTTTISVPPTVVIRNEDGGTITLSDISVGSHVRIIATGNAGALSATRIVVNAESNESVDARISNLRAVIAKLQALIAFLKGLQVH